MESSSFHYSHEGQEEEAEEGRDVPCFLDIYVHDACNVHNICIYAEQDVYAKFSLTSSADGALSTRVVRGGGRSPRFTERLPPLRVAARGLRAAVLKCEVWMRSCARRLLEDQLLGFALVPLAAVAAAAGGRLEQDFALSSTDLFHSPAGTIRLALALHSEPSDEPFPPPERAAEQSITSEVVILEPSPPVDYGRIEFPDLNVARQNHEMAMQYFDMAPAQPGVPFLRLGASPPSPPPIEDCEMTASSDDQSKNVSGALTDSTTTTASDDRASCSEFMAQKPNADEAAAIPGCTPGTPTSKTGAVTGKNRADVFKSPLGDIINLEAEQSAMQQQIMEMYMKSMQQFTESLAKMKLPMELGGGGGGGERGPDSDHGEKLGAENSSKKDGARVFYGSRAFF